MDALPQIWKFGPPINTLAGCRSQEGVRAVRETFGLLRAISRAALVLILPLTIVGCGNMKPTRNCAPPCPEARGETVGSAASYRAPDPSVFQMLADKLQGPAPAERPAHTCNTLAISGGGKYGAFSAGVLCGWSESGNRPTFDVVTGVSTGAIVALFAFLGPQYDDQLRTFYTTVHDRDIYIKKPVLYALVSNSFLSSRPLKRIIDRTIDEKMIAELAAAHTAHRRLLIGTTNLDTKRACGLGCDRDCGGPTAGQARVDSENHSRISGSPW